jgi:hypothetical protein
LPTEGIAPRAFRTAANGRHRSVRRVRRPLPGASRRRHRPGSGRYGGRGGPPIRRRQRHRTSASRPPVRAEPARTASVAAARAPQLVWAPGPPTALAAGSAPSRG